MMVQAEKLRYNQIPMNEALRLMQTRNRLPREPKSDFLTMPEEETLNSFRVTDEITSVSTEVPLQVESEIEPKTEELDDQELRNNRVMVVEPSNERSEEIETSDNVLRGEIDLFATSGALHQVSNYLNLEPCKTAVLKLGG